MAASVPVIEQAAVTVLPLPTFLSAKVPACVRFTTSGEITPTKLPFKIVAVALPLYTLFCATAPLTVNAFAVMFLAVSAGCVNV